MAAPHDLAAADRRGGYCRQLRGSCPCSAAGGGLAEVTRGAVTGAGEVIAGG